MKKLLNNRGSVLFVTVIFFTVLLCGLTLSTLITSYSYGHKRQLDSLYAAYDYESYSKIVVHELISCLDDVQVSVNPSPLLSTAELQMQLQSALRNSYFDISGTWVYSDLEAIANDKLTVSVSGYDTIIKSDFKPTSNMAVPMGDLAVAVTWATYTYTATICDVYLNYSFYNNQLSCRYDTTSCRLAGGHLRCI